MPKDKQGGLAGIIAGQSAIATVGLGSGLNYRGYSIQDLAQHCIFEQIVHLLLIGKLPTNQELVQYRKKISSKRRIPKELKKVLEIVPKNAHPMEVMRTIGSVMGLLQPQSQENNQYEIALRLIAMFGPAILYWYHYSKSGIKINEQTNQNDTIAQNFSKLLTMKNQVDPLIIRTIDVSLILYAEHDFAASTFSARITASTLSDFYSCITSGIGTLRGPLHGGANQAAMQFLSSIKNIQDSDRVLQQRWKNKRLIMGFGHRIYKNEDPRNPIIKRYSIALSEKPLGNKNLVDISRHIQSRMINQKNIHPNLDFYAASAYHQCGIQTNLFTPIFVISRTSGWGAHIIQQRKKNKLIRPNSKYIGPQRQSFILLKHRPKL